MEAATLPAPHDEQLVAQHKPGALFMSRRDGLRLTYVQRYPVMGADGRKRGETAGKVVVFKDAVFRCPYEGPVKLEDGRTSDGSEIIEWLDQHPLLGDREEGFWRVDEQAPAPSADEMKTLLRAAAGRDLATIERFIEQEKAGWNRAELLDAAYDLIDSVQQATAQAPAAAAGEGVAGVAPAKR